jgi:hypothetical protein
MGGCEATFRMVTRPTNVSTLSVPEPGENFNQLPAAAGVGWQQRWGEADEPGYHESLARRPGREGEHGH